MQRVTRINPNVHRIMDEIDTVYTLTSDTATNHLLNPILDESFYPLLSAFREYGLEYYPVDYVNKSYNPLSVNDNKTMVLAFSGGKDSIASAIKLRDEGYYVYLYHMKKVNRSLSDEWESAKKCADLLDMPIFFDEISYSGNHMWMEHPMKNMIIANGALSFAIRKGLTTNIAFGNYNTSVLRDNPFDRCAGDCMDMWETYETIIQRVLPNFKIHCNLENMEETLEIISEHQELYEASHSCLCRHSLRPYRNNWVKEKYGIELPTIRCGSCYKCCVDYIFMADHNKTKFSEEYYKYCLNQLLKVMVAESDIPRSIEDVWNHFMLYDIEQSKIFEQMNNAVVLLGGIKWL